MEVDRLTGPRGVAVRNRRPAPITGVRVGTLVASDAGAAVRVVFAPEFPERPVPARTTIALSPQHVGRDVLLAFEDGDPSRPIVTGILIDSVGPTDEGTLVRPGPPTGIVADGRRLTVEAGRELVLQCGKSSITLHADGSVYIRGMRIVSRARGANKVKGSTVEIN